MTDDSQGAVQRAADTLRARIGPGSESGAGSARVGLILGTGLGQLAREIDAAATVPYSEIPGFPLSTVESHSGQLVAGTLRGVPVLAMEGRFHLYEAYSAQQITFPVRVMAALGVRTLVVSNAAGGLNPAYARGSLMLLSDHINLQGENPLTGPNVDAWGPRFPDMSDAYDPGLRTAAHAAAGKAGIDLQEGVYVAVAGPSLETRAEYGYLRRIGADAVGMSTVPEVTVARHMGLRCMAVSVITDECVPETLVPVSLADVLAAAAEAEPRLTRLVGDVVEGLG